MESNAHRRALCCCEPILNVALSKSDIVIPSLVSGSCGFDAGLLHPAARTVQCVWTRRIQRPIDQPQRSRSHAVRIGSISFFLKGSSEVGPWMQSMDIKICRCATSSFVIRASQRVTFLCFILNGYNSGTNMLK